MCVFASVPAFAQGGSATSTIGGSVVDSSGAAIPGATIEAKNPANGTVYSTVSSSQGTFSIPAVASGSYTVTVSLQGFKTTVLNNIMVSVGQSPTVNVKLEVGGVSETVTVEGAAAVVQTQQTAVSSTITTKAIESLPLTSRNVIDYLTFMPGVNVAGTNREANVNGLPGAAVNITLDGVNIQDNTLKSRDGFFTIVQPRLDAIQEVTITGAAAGATDGQGAISVKFTTRSGTNSYAGSLYNYFRSDKLNENTWFNKRDGVAIAKLKQNQTGGRFGGPIWIPGLFNGRNKAFFFVNAENFLQPAQTTRTRTILTTQGQAGIFRYRSNSVNLLSLAAANGQTSTIDPTIAQLLVDIRNATATTGTISDSTDPRFQTYSYNANQKGNNWYPTGRIDVNITNSHKLSTVINFDTFSTKPDLNTNGFEPTFPGFPNFGSQTSKRFSISNTLRSTFGRNMVNSFLFAVQASPVKFFPEQDTIAPWTGPLANQKGFQLNISGAGITNAGPGPSAQSRDTIVTTFSDTLNWQKGNHSLQFGADVTQFRIWLQNHTAVPTVTFGLQTADPARAFFTPANFPGAGSADLTNAQNLYAVLTGRITQIAGNARIDEASGKYVYQGSATQRGTMLESDFFVQDQWRLRPNLTINYGVRYVLQGAFQAANSLYSFATVADAFGVSGLSGTCDGDEPTASTCNIFKPGTLPGTKGVYQQLTKGTKAYDLDMNNIAPSIGINWTPSSDSGFLKRVMGDPGQFSIRGGWSRSFNRNGLSDFTGVYNGNPGILTSVTKNETNGNLGANPVLLRNDSQIGPAAFPESPVYPIATTTANSINVFARNLQVPYADSYTFGIQRGVTKNTAVEVRYVGTRSRDTIVTYNLNGENNVIENGFLGEFKNAQANLQANNAAGGSRTGSFKYFGAGTGTVPLPIYQAYFSGVTAANAGNAALYTSANYTSSTFVNFLAKYNPCVFCEAGSLNSTATFKANGIAAGLPSNFFIVNPDVSNANITGNGGFTRFNGLQTEVRRRLANGFQVQANYAFGRGYTADRYSFRVARKATRNTGPRGDVTHALKATAVVELPFGQGKRWFNSAGPILDRIIGGWQVNFNTRIQSGRLIDFGNVRMVGFDAKELNRMFKVRHDSSGSDGKERIYMLPADVITESIKAFSTSATSVTGYGALGAPSGKYFAPANSPECLETISAGYGDCGVRTLVVTGPRLTETDLSVVKMVKLFGHVRGEFHVEALNVFNNINFVPVGGVGGTQLSNYETTALTGITAARVVQLVSRITW